MAQLQKLEGQVEVNCSADMLFEMVMAQQPNIPTMCSHKVASIKAHHGDWISPGTIRTWNCVIDGKSRSMTERIDEVDIENKTVVRKVMGGDMLKHYTTLTNTIRVIPKGNDGSVMVFCLEYEKATEDAPEPRKMLEFALGLFKEVGSHLAN